MHILPYLSLPAEFRAYDSRVIEIFHSLESIIQGFEPELRVEHVGSTSVPGCSGKGIVDLAILYPEGFLERARATLDRFGFQKQTGPDPFPEDRPMRVGAVEHSGKAFRIHAHVIALDSDEHRELLFFRQALRASLVLREQYEDRKRAILAMGIDDPVEYCEAKSAFITGFLKMRRDSAR